MVRLSSACFRRRWAASLAAWLIVLAGPVGAQDRAIFHADTRLVVLYATVRNARGELVTDLNRDAFSVYENGKRQNIALFRRDDLPVSLGLLIDNSGSMRALRARVEAAALACVRASHAQDEVFVLNFADKAQLDVPFTNDIRVLEAGIGRVDSIGGTAMRDAIQLGSQYLTEHARHDRRVILMVTDGKDNASMVSMEHIRKQAARNDITVYAIGLSSSEDEATARRAHHELDELAETTGGAAYFTSSLEGLDEIVLDIARQIRNRYTIAYTPLDQRFDGSYRHLRVVARGRERLIVRSRAGYLATPATATKF
jgi:Ca-activated chloride channel homolog